jgi:NADH-quinone oxidoreductase subunit E
MTHYMIELALWIFLIFFIGCAIGYILRQWLGSTEAMAPAEDAVAQPEPVAAASVAAPVAAVLPEMSPAPEPAQAATLRMERPRGLAEPRGGKADDLLLIRGIGPKNQKILHTLGFFHFDQIGSWTAEQIEWVDDHLKFNGRIVREEWVVQARLLSEGNDEEFTRRFGQKRSK